MSDLITSLKGQLSSAMLEKLATNLGENPANVTKAMNGLLPTVLGGIITKSTDSGVMSTVMSALSNRGNQGLLDGVGTMIVGNAMGHNHAENPAAGMISSLFGSRVDTVLGAISAVSGVKQSSASSLMGLASSLVIGLLGSKVAGGMGLSALTNLLMKEAPEIMAALPGGMGKMLGLKTPALPSAPIVQNVPNRTATTLLWIGLLAGLGVLLFWWQGRSALSAPPVQTTQGASR